MRLESYPYRELQTTEHPSSSGGEKRQNTGNPQTTEKVVSFAKERIRALGKDLAPRSYPDHPAENPEIRPYYPEVWYLDLEINRSPAVGSGVIDMARKAARYVRSCFYETPWELLHSLVSGNQEIRATLSWLGAKRELYSLSYNPLKLWLTNPVKKLWNEGWVFARSESKNSLAIAEITPGILVGKLREMHTAAKEKAEFLERQAVTVLNDPAYEYANYVDTLVDEMTLFLSEYKEMLARFANASIGDASVKSILKKILSGVQDDFVLVSVNAFYSKLTEFYSTVFDAEVNFLKEGSETTTVPPFAMTGAVRERLLERAERFKTCFDTLDAQLGNLETYVGHFEKMRRVV